jgi:hypothetical protein
MFTLSATRYSLFEVMPDSPIKGNAGGELVLRLLTNNADSKKAFEAATQFLAVADKITVKKLTVIVGKPKADIEATQPSNKPVMILSYTVTKAELTRRSKAIVELHDSDIKPEVLLDDSKAGGRKMGRGLVAGLIE